MEHRNKDEYTQGNKVELIRGGKPFFDRLVRMIDTAKDCIHLQVYIFDDDETGRMVGEALKKAAARKVSVYVLADGYASQVLSQAFIDELREAGIHFRLFEPLYRSKYFYFGRRLHHKLFVTDGCYAMVGGINITDKYNDMPGVPAWLDFAVFTEGEVVKELEQLCVDTWKDQPDIQKTIPRTSNNTPKNTSPGKSLVSVRRNDWVSRKQQVSATYINMFKEARSHITILSSYFLPGKLLRKHLKDAARRGIRIKVITAGVSDVVLSKYAERFMYDWYLRNGIVIYEYTCAVLHGKISVCDSEWLTVGSYNVNNISAYASIELNLNIRDKDFAVHTEQTLWKIVDKDCREISSDYHSKTTNWLKRIAHWFSYWMVRFMFFVSTFYFRPHGSKRQ
jgi:cardiolipin synthase